MIGRTRIASIVVTAVVGSMVVGCRSSHGGAAGESSAPEQGAQAEVAVKQVTVPEVARLLKEKSATVVDANGAETRQEYGVVPGAILLSNYKSYSLGELPPSKSSKLVFYCGGVMCRASDAAAARAAANGYTDVSIMRDGIKGWKGAGQPTETPRS